jgi:hypothetical protein
LRILFIIAGVLLVIVGVACTAPSFVTYRSLDSDGYINGSGRMTTRSAALVTATAQFKEVTEEEVEQGRTGGDTILRIRAERADGGEVVVGVASAAALDSLLVTGSYEIVNDLDFEPFRYSGVGLRGVQPLARPEAGLFAAYAAGTGAQEITWTVEAGEWQAVIMNADGSPGVEVDVRFGARFPYLRGWAIAGMVVGGAIPCSDCSSSPFSSGRGETKSTVKSSRLNQLGPDHHLVGRRLTGPRAPRLDAVADLFVVGGFGGLHVRYRVPPHVRVHSRNVEPERDHLHQAHRPVVLRVRVEAAFAPGHHLEVVERFGGPASSER